MSYLTTRIFQGECLIGEMSYDWGCGVVLLVAEKVDEALRGCGVGLGSTLLEGVAGEELQAGLHVSSIRIPAFLNSAVSLLKR